MSGAPFAKLFTPSTKALGEVLDPIGSVPGVTVPAELIGRLTDCSKDDREKVSVEICGQLIRDAKHLCQGAHLMTLGWDHLVPDIISAAGLA